MDLRSQSLGMIETWGIPALIAAADAAVKTADVRITSYEKADAGIVTVYFVGEVAAVKAAVEAGGAEARRVGKLLSTHVIPRPDPSVASLVQNMLPAMDTGALIYDKEPEGNADKPPARRGRKKRGEPAT